MLSIIDFLVLNGVGSSLVGNGFVNLRVFLNLIGIIGVNSLGKVMFMKFFFLLGGGNFGMNSRKLDFWVVIFFLSKGMMFLLNI